MAVEIERKFLIHHERWRPETAGESIRQGYLSVTPERTVRVRVRARQGTLTVKGPSRGAERLEFEYEIPLADAEQLLEMCRQPLIEKIRYLVPHAGQTWEVDEFRGENAGLWLAECELTSTDQEIELPPWIRSEVTGDRRYSNSQLQGHPYCRWQDRP